MATSSGCGMVGTKFICIREVPADIPANTTEVQLEQNLISVIHANAFSHLHVCKVIDLSLNMISKIEPGAFDGLDQLETLDLGFNSLAKIKANTFDKMPELKDLKLGYNDIVSLSDNVFDKLLKLETLDLSGNKLSELDLGSAVWAGLGSLKVLTIKKNGFTTIHPGTRMPALETLDLGYNNFKDLPDNVFDKLLKLEWLDLLGNNLTEIRSGMWGGLRSLKHLILYQNDITTIQPGSFAKLQEQGLRYVSVANNKLTTLNRNIFQGIDLQLLHTRADLP